MRRWVWIAAAMLAAGGGACGSGGGSAGGFAGDAGVDAGGTGASAGSSPFGGSAGSAATGGVGAAGGVGGVGGAAGAAGSSGAAGSGGGPTRYWYRATAPDGKSFTALHGSSATDVWAVGTHGLAARYDGTQWKDVSILEDRPVKAVAVASPTSVWIAADYPGDVFRWNGAGWQKDSYYFPVTTVYELFASSPSDVWLGTQWNFTAGPAYHFDGVGWSKKSMPGDDGIVSIWRTAPTAVWAVTTAGALMFHDGLAWTTAIGTTTLKDVWGSGANDVWAVGSDLRHFDGGSWKLDSSLGATSLSAISGSAHDDVWAVGSGTWRFDGSSWSQPTDAGLPSDGSDVWVASPADVFVIKGGAIYYSKPVDCAASAKCDGLCVDTLIDDEHCGGCNTSCGDGDCKSGSCQCDGGETFCDGWCEDTQTSEQHCGGCGKACPKYGVCTAGVCGCPAWMIQCGDTCVSTSSSSDHCGACGQACGSGKYCESGQCVCFSSTTNCGGLCIDTKSDPKNCGACGNACAVACEGSACITAVEIAAGTLSTCARMSDGSVRCWGRKSNGSAATKPAKMSSIAGASSIDAGGSEQYPHLQGMCAAFGSGEVRCADYLLSTTSLVPGLSNAVQVETGFENSWDFRCALRSDKTVGCFGSNTNGTLGDGVTLSSSTPLTPPGLPPAEEVSVGDYGACARTSTGGVWCWGVYISSSSAGHKPKDQGIDSAIDISVGDNSVYAVISDGTLRWANNYGGNVVTGATNVVSVSAGDNSRGCVVHGDQTVSCWTLGSSIAKVPGLSNVAQVSTGSAHACALTVSGQVYCWGKNGVGQLGTGDTQEKTTPTAVVW